MLYITYSCMIGMSDTYERMLRMREIELKHARIAMVAAFAWPVSELIKDSLFSRLSKTFMDPSAVLEAVRRPLPELFERASYSSTMPYALSNSHEIDTVVSGALIRNGYSGVFFVLASALEYFLFLNRKSLSRKYPEVSQFKLLYYDFIVVEYIKYLNVVLVTCLFTVFKYLYEPHSHAILRVL